MSKNSDFISGLQVAKAIVHKALYKETRTVVREELRKVREAIANEITKATVQTGWIFKDRYK